MKVLPGGTKFSGFVRQQGQGDGGAVTVTPAFTTILELPQFTVTTDDYIFVSVYVEITKGATAGITHLEVGRKGGSAALSYAGGSYSGEFTNQAAFTMQHVNGTVWRLSATLLFLVTAGGTLTLGLHGQSFGSNGTIVNGASSLSYFVASIGT